MTTANLFGTAIRHYCESQCPKAGTAVSARQCTAKGCALWAYRLDAQVQLFDGHYRAWWFEVADAYVDHLPATFWMSQFRERFDMGINLPGPARREWWGTLTRRWLRRGYTMTGRSQPSPTPSLNGSREQEWTRGERWQAYEGKGIQYLVELQEKAA